MTPFEAPFWTKPGPNPKGSRDSECGEKFYYVCVERLESGTKLGGKSS